MVHYAREVVLQSKQFLWSRRLNKTLQTQSCKIPGKLKIEKETRTGFFIALSPKTSILGDDDDFKR